MSEVWMKKTGEIQGSRLFNLHSRRTNKRVKNLYNLTSCNYYNNKINIIFDITKLKFKFYFSDNFSLVISKTIHG